MRRTALRLALALLLAPMAAHAAEPAPAALNGATPAPAAIRLAMPKPFTDPEYVLGSPGAKVVVVEYASVACPHCAKFDAQVFPALKAKYIDTGKVRYAIREMLVGDEAMVGIAAAGFVTARCAGRAHYFDVVEAMYRAQPEIFNSGDLKGPLVRIAKANGLDEAQLNACLNDQAALDALNARVKQAEDVQKVNSTPSFFVDGVKLDEHGKEPDLALFDAAIQPRLKAARR